MEGYYSEKLSAQRLRKCYEIAPPRVQQYLDAEIDHVLSRIRPTDLVLELGCGYGRVLERLAPVARTVVGIDTSSASLRLASDMLRDRTNCHLARTNAIALGFQDRVFDVVACIQNGVSVFGVDRRALIVEAVRVTRPAGRVLLASYSERFWDDRLEWFRLQAEYGLLGEIDWAATGDGVIVCKDGFQATTTRLDEFVDLTTSLGTRVRVAEVDQSSVFCEITV